MLITNNKLSEAIDNFIKNLSKHDKMVPEDQNEIITEISGNKISKGDLMFFQLQKQGNDVVEMLINDLLKE